MERLNNKNIEIFNKYISDVSDKNTELYMLTIARDGEDPVRSIILYNNSIDAVEGYKKYTDCGFAKNYLTVKLYEPSGKINEKILKRNQAGESTFVRQNYIDVEEALLKVKNSIDPDIFYSLCFDIALAFSKDSWRFDSDRFFSILGINSKV